MGCCNNEADSISLKEAYAIKFAILASIFVVFVAYFLGGYLHAQRRIKKGLPPLAYHRVSRLEPSLQSFADSRSVAPFPSTKSTI